MAQLVKQLVHLTGRLQSKKEHVLSRTYSLFLFLIATVSHCLMTNMSCDKKQQEKKTKQMLVWINNNNILEEPENLNIVIQTL